MTTPEAEIPDSDPVVAGELALGLLEGEPRAAALRRTLAEPAFAAAVDQWRQRFAPLLDGIAEATPPAHVWGGVEGRLATPARTIGSVGLWRTVAVGALAVAASLALIIVNSPPTPVIVEKPVPVAVAPPARDMLVAQVADKAGEPLLVARYEPAARALHVRTSNLPQGELRPELWVIGGGDAKPRSLGLVALNGKSDVTPDARLVAALVPGSVFAVTMEPVEGAPHPAPSGDILGTAKLALI